MHYELHGVAVDAGPDAQAYTPIHSIPFCHSFINSFVLLLWNRTRPLHMHLNTLLFALVRLITADQH